MPVTAFPDGLLKGATTPRQLAEKARTNPQETARLLQNGSVARWYQSNGWTYPITGPAATGLALVQQYFEVLGLTMPTRVELRTSAVTLRGAAGGTARGGVVLGASEKRPIYVTPGRSTLADGRPNGIQGPGGRYSPECGDGTCLLRPDASRRVVGAGEW